MIDPDAVAAWHVGCRDIAGRDGARGVTGGVDQADAETVAARIPNVEDVGIIVCCRHQEAQIGVRTSSHGAFRVDPVVRRVARGFHVGPAGSANEVIKTLLEETRAVVRAKVVTLALVDDNGPTFVSGNGVNVVGRVKRFGRRGELAPVDVPDNDDFRVGRDADEGAGRATIARD